jgi:quercetin dioxygenase-like cupin family protein
MNRKFNMLFILGLGISLAFIACNQGGKQEEATTTTDSTGSTMTDTAQTMAVAQDAGIDALKAAPDLYKLVKDTMGIRVLEVTYKPGDSSVLHSHPDYVIYTINGGTAEFTEKDGKKMVSEMKSGGENIRPGEVHSVKNTGKTTIKVLLVEVNRPKETISQDPAMDATKVAPDLYKSKKDTLGIRVLEATYKPGQSSALHSHPDNAVYVINPGTVEFTEKDGTKHTNEFKAGVIMVRPGGVHSVKNTGKTTLKVLLVEVNRPMK